MARWMFAVPVSRTARTGSIVHLPSTGPSMGLVAVEGPLSEIDCQSVQSVPGLGWDRNQSQGTDPRLGGAGTGEVASRTRPLRRSGPTATSAASECPEPRNGSPRGAHFAQPPSTACQRCHTAPPGPSARRVPAASVAGRPTTVPAWAPVGQRPAGPFQRPGEGGRARRRPSRPGGWRRSTPRPRLAAPKNLVMGLAAFRPALNSAGNRKKRVTPGT